MAVIDGKKRVVITNVSPRVDDGMFPAKGVIDQPVFISASVFCDGHDRIAAQAMIQHEGERKSTLCPMALVNNDHWETTFTPKKMGLYRFAIEAWIDHFATWQHGLKKKYDAQQNVSIDLLIGDELIDKAIEHAAQDDSELLAAWSGRLRVVTPECVADLVALALDPTLTALMTRTASRNEATTTPVKYDIVVERTRAGFSAWYELFPRSTALERAQHGTFKDVRNLLPRIAKMGFDVLYFPPIHPIGNEKRKGKNNALIADSNDVGSPWAVGNSEGGHKSINSKLGSLKDFRDLLAEAKSFGLEIALDIALQCAPDHPYVREHPQWFKWRPDGSVQFAENPPKKYEDILPLNFETDDWKNLWEELKSIFEYWMDQGVDIFRVDNPHTKAFLFWQWLIPLLRKKNPNVILLAEAFTRPRIMERLAKSGFTQSYTYFTWRITKKELEDYLTELSTTDLQDYFRPNFWPNTPDILPPHLTDIGPNAHMIRFILAATMSSNYGVYGPVFEFALNQASDGKEEYIDNEKYEVQTWEWHQETKISEIMSLINKVRNENSAFRNTNNIRFLETTNDRIISFIKTDLTNDNTVIIVVNLDPNTTQSAWVRVPLPHTLAKGARYRVYDYLSGDFYNWSNDWNYVQLNPFDMPAHVLKIIP